MTLYQPKAKSADDFNIIGRYKEEIEWLRDECYDSGLTTLLTEFPNEPERNLILTLLSRVQHFNISDRVNDIATLVKRIEELQLDPQKTLIVATAKESESDGSKAWQYFFKFYLAQHRTWNENALVSSLESSYQKLVERVYENVIIFDDFIGSGETMVRKVNEFSSSLEQRKLKVPNIHIFALAGMEFGVRYIEGELNKEVVCPVLVKKGISEQEINEQQKDDEIQLMLKMEKSLEQRYKWKAFTGKCSLGFNKSEALYQVQYTNCANNVFPIFWLAPKGKNRFRNTLFYRL
ncbi:phosphoribosyltransferase [Vibrio metschnikovii]|uniref:phosphoribosyltransferase n=1 Tax=Vibrio metschnikovii TaxID=28172 RepID=UPI001C309DD1|nr:phosphoribosyltransferase [Vibrio metschnikovii]